MRGTFLCFAKEKYPKERRPHCLRPLRFAPGQPAVLAGGVRCGTRCALARSAQTAAASQFTKRVCPAAHAPPRPLRSSAHPEGSGEPNIPTGLCFARSSLRSAWRLRPRDDAERSNGPNGCWLFGCSDVPPLLAAPAAGRLGGGTRVGARVLRELTRRGCLNEAASQRSEFHGAPRNRHDAGLPWSEAQGSQTGGRLFFGDFLLAKQKKVTRMPGDSRLPHSTRACSSHRAKASTGPTRTDGMVPRLRQAQPKRERENSGTIKTIATYAL